MSLNVEALEAAKKALRIVDVYFRDERVSLDKASTPPFWPECHRTQFRMATRILQDFEVAGEVEEDDGSTSEQNARFLEVEFSGSVRCLADQPDAEDRELIAMDVCLGLLYEVAAECAEDGIDEFVRMNVPYHAIPYWREHIHGVCAKRRFRPITVPMYIQAMQQGEPRVVEKAED